MNELERIVERTRGEVAAAHGRSGRLPEVERDAVKARLAERPRPAGSPQALAAPGLSVIAEHKRRSPVGGDLIRDGSRA